MKDSKEKDPFAEYDKYWDELEKKEKAVNEKHNKEYGFSDVNDEENKHSFEFSKEHLKYLMPLIVLVFFMVFGEFKLFSPLLLFIFIGIAISIWKDKV